MSKVLLACALLLPSPGTVALNIGGIGRSRPAFKASKVSGPRKAIAIPVDQPTFVPTEEETKSVNADGPDAWVKKLDYEAFGRDVTELGKQLQREQGQEDVDHLKTIVRWRDWACIMGVSTMAFGPNPLTIAALSTWTYASWTMIAHHTCHGGYNRVDAGKYNSRGFALGSVVKRVTDWCDWMLPEAWNVEHNRLHHYHLGEPKDPDLVERNLDFLREMDVPLPIKYAVVAALIPVWKWFYYAPNTYKELKLSQMRANKEEIPAGLDVDQAYTFKTVFVPENESQAKLNELLKPKKFFAEVFGPFLVTRFLLLPAPLLLLPFGWGPIAFGHAVVNLVLAELLTNIHAFVTIVTNHAGNDLYTFDDEVKPKTGSFYVRQIVSSANYKAGTDLIDFSHGWLNYQIEHHVWPDFSMLQYQRGAPLLKAVCDHHGVPYIQESVWERTRKTIDIMVGRTSMKTFPTELEPSKDKALKGVTWKSTNGAIDEDEEEKSFE